MSKKYNIVIVNEFYSKAGTLIKTEETAKYEGVTLNKLQLLAGRFMIENPEACGFKNEDLGNKEDRFLTLRIFSCDDKEKLTAHAFLVDEVG